MKTTQASIIRASSTPAKITRYTIPRIVGTIGGTLAEFEFSPRRAPRGCDLQLISVKASPHPAQNRGRMASMDGAARRLSLLYPGIRVIGWRYHWIHGQAITGKILYRDGRQYFTKKDGSEIRPCSPVPC